jgi:exodeoxyribonuclease X
MPHLQYLYATDPNTRRRSTIVYPCRNISNRIACTRCKKAVPLKISETCFAVVDTETTGLDPSKDRIVEFAMRDSLGYGVDFLVNPEIPIPADVSGIHHLTSVDLIYAMLNDQAMERIERVVMPSYIVVAHNAQFDRAFLPCLNDRTWLCSKRLAQHLFPEAPNHKNQTLRYHLGCNYQGQGLDLKGLAPHRALADVIVTSAILKVLLNQYNALYGDDLDALLAFAASPITITAMPFGKHAGTKLVDLPTDYIEWCISPRGITDNNDLTLSLQAELERRNA